VRGEITSLAPKVAGYVVSVEVSDNPVVRQGEILFRIDDADFQAKLAQAEANLSAARARLDDLAAQNPDAGGGDPPGDRAAPGVRHRPGARDESQRPAAGTVREEILWPSRNAATFGMGMLSYLIVEQASAS